MSKTNKRIAVMNLGGNVGKTTITRHLLAPRMGDCQIISVESINADEAEANAFKGKEFSNVIQAAMAADACVIDVGASNIETFLQRMNDYAGAAEMIDLFIIPVTHGRKQIMDTISTVEMLADAGAEKSKIVIVLNKVEDFDTIESDFSGVLQFGLDNGINIGTSLAIGQSDIFGQLRPGESLSDVAFDTRDFRGESAEATDPEAKSELMAHHMRRLLAKNVVTKLDKVFNEVIG